MSKTFNMTGGGGGGIKLVSIAITTPPSKTSYVAGESFNASGMVVTATYSNGATLKCTGYNYEPSTGLTDGTTKVIIRYTEGGVTKTAEQVITVLHKLQSITITTNPTKTNYVYGESFNASGMVVKATYSDGATATVSGYSCSPSSFSSIGSQDVTVRYTENGYSAVTTLGVNVSKAPNTVTVNPASISLGTKAKTATFIVSRKGNGTISASSNDTSVAKVSSINQSTGVVTISSVNDTNGTAIISVSVAEGTYYLAGAGKTVSVTAQFREYLYGYDIDLDNSDPSARVTYPSDVDNASFTPAAMNFSSDVFNYGGWAFDPGEKFMPRPCMLTYAGVVDHYLNPNDYTKKVDGTASSVADSSFGGNAMMEWPKIYTKRWESNGVYHFRCSDTPQDDEWDCWCNYDRNDNQIDHFYTPIYFGSLISGKLRSSCGIGITGLNELYTDATAASEITYAKANGDDWYTEVLADRLLLHDLLVMMARSTECQTAFGYGRCKSSLTNSIRNGTMNTKGMFWGSNNQTSGVKVFGMENVWGNLWRRTAGWINDNGTQKVKLTRGTHDGSTAADYNADGSGYKTVANTTPAGKSGGYISSMKTEAFGRLPVTASGSSSTYEADGMWYNNGYVDYAFFGGRYSGGLLVGPFYADLSYRASDKGPTLGAAISCKPLAAA